MINAANGNDWAHNYQMGTTVVIQKDEYSGEG